MTAAVIVAHPDDEVLGFGGVMARHADAGEAVHVMFLATGLAARHETNTVDAGALAALRDQARAAATVLGAHPPDFADFPDNRMDSVPLLDIVRAVEGFLTAHTPTTVYTHHGGDLNIDHAVVARAVLTACRPLPGGSVRALYAGEVLSSSEYGHPDARFVPQRYVDIDAQLTRKCQALQCYHDELRSWPHPRSVAAVTHCARLRGSECGVPAAEAFQLIRAVEI